MKRIILGFFFLACCADPASAFTLSNFDTPESCVVDPADGYYYISNINGGPTDKDGNGYISKVNASGSLVIQKFIGGKEGDPVLNAPKGLAIVGKTLYVTDIDALKGFDKETGKQVLNLDLSKYKAKFLNDMSADAKGVLYLSDTMANLILIVNPLKADVRVLKEGAELGGPNGVLVNPKSKNLVIVTWGSGRILEMMPSGSLHVLKRDLKALDGADLDAAGNLYVSSFEKGEIYKISNYGRGPISLFMSGLTTPADISCDRKKSELLVPSFKGNTVATVPLQKAKLSG